MTPAERYLRDNIERNINDPLQSVLQEQVTEMARERDAWKTLHDARGNGTPYAYASQAQLEEIKRARKIVGR